MKSFSLDDAKSRDQADPLRTFRDRFFFPLTKTGEKKIYFLGNSLGLQPKQTREYIHRELEDWEKLGARGHFHATNPWYYYHHKLKPGLSHLVGSLETEVVGMNSLTTNLHLMMVTFFRPTKDRYKILMLKSSFPSDQYAVQSQLKFHGLDKTALIEVESDQEAIVKSIRENGNEIALVLIEGVSYLTGQYFDLQNIVQEGHANGCTVGFDLGHAVGNLPLHLHDWNADFAVWCNYKYVNAGPGAIGGCFVHERHSKNDLFPKLKGWWGHSEKRRLLMEPTFVPNEGIDSWQISNVPILSAAALLASLDLFVEVGIENVRKKSMELTGYAEHLLREVCKRKVDILTPSDPARRGCQLSLMFHENAKGVFDKLIESEIACDWREPNVIRIAPVPLYNSFEDVIRFVETLNSL